MTGDDRYKKMFKKKKEVRSMCDVAERLERMGIEKGKAEEKKARVCLKKIRNCLF